MWKAQLKVNPKSFTKPRIKLKVESDPEENECCKEAKRYLHYWAIAFAEIDYTEPHQITHYRDGKEHRTEELYDEKYITAAKNAQLSDSEIKYWLDMPCDEFRIKIKNACDNMKGVVGVDWCAVELFVGECEEGYSSGAEQWHTVDNWLWGDAPRTAIWDKV